MWVFVHSLPLLWSPTYIFCRFYFLFPPFIIILSLPFFSLSSPPSYLRLFSLLNFSFSLFFLKGFFFYSPPLLFHFTFPIPSCLPPSTRDTSFIPPSPPLLASDGAPSVLLLDWLPHAAPLSPRPPRPASPSACWVTIIKLKYPATYQRITQLSTPRTQSSLPR